MSEQPGSFPAGSGDLAAPESPPSTNYFASYIWNAIAKIGDFGLAYLFSVLLARNLEPAGYGAYASILSICTLALVFTSTGMDRALHKFLGEFSASRELSRSIPSFLRWLFLLRILVTAAVTTGVYGARGWIATRFDDSAVAPLIAVALLYIVSQSLVSFGVNALVGFLRTKTVAVFTVVFRATNIGLAYWLLARGTGVGEIMLMLGITSSALFVAYLSKILPMFMGETRRISLSSVLAFTSSVWVLAAVNFGLGKQSDVILLNAIRHNQLEVALYDVAYSLTQSVALILTIGLAGISLTLFSRRYGSKPEGMVSLWRSFVVLIGATVVPFVVFLVLHAPACVVAIYGPSYEEAGSLVRVYAIPMLAAWLLGGGTSSTILHAIYRIRVVLWIRVVTGVLNILVNILLIRAYGPRGALLGTALCALTSVVIETVAVRREVKGSIPFRHMLGLAIAIAVAAVPSLLTRPEGFFALAAHGALFVGIYFAVLTGLKPFPQLDEGLLAAFPAPIARWVRRLTRNGETP